MKLLKTLLVISLMSVGLAAHASGGRDDDEHEGGGCGGGGSGTTCNNIINLDFTSSDALTVLGDSFAVSMNGFEFTVSGSVQSRGGRSFNDVVWSQYGFGIDSSKDTGSAKDLVNEYEIIKFTFTDPTSVSLVGARFLDKKGKSIDSDDEQYEYRVDGGGWSSRQFDSDGFRDFETGTEFEFRHADDDGESFWVSGLDVCPPVAPIPEPETYALMVAGLGLVGFMARRRKVMQGASA